MSSILIEDTIYGKCVVIFLEDVRKSSVLGVFEDYFGSGAWCFFPIHFQDVSFISPLLEGMFCL